MKKTKTRRKNSKSNDKKTLASKYSILSELMEHTPDVIYFKDKNGKLIMVNQAHAKGLGLPPEKVVGKTDFDIFPKKRAEKMASDDKKVIKTGKPIIDKIERATRADGVDNYVSTTKIPRFDSNGKVIGLMGITRDITRRMQIDKLRKEKERIENSLAKQEEQNKMISEFVALIAHEIRTPLTFISVALSILDDERYGPITNRQKELTNKCLSQMKNLNCILEELLDISKIESSQFHLHYSLVNLNDLIMDSSSFLKKRAQEKGSVIEYSIPKHQVYIFIDAVRINQVITNIINNAIKYTDQNGKINVNLRVLKDYVRVEVFDNGIGIARSNLLSLFNKFAQVSNNVKSKTSGVGLGLAIVKELVQKHGGEIWVKSKLGVGTKFYFTLPLLYTTNMLDEDIKDEINSLLDKGKSVSLINMLIVNYNQFKIRIKSKKVYSNIISIVQKTCDTLSKSNREKPQIVYTNEKQGECSILSVNTGEREANKVCGQLKNNLNKYFSKARKNKIFVNIGLITYSPKRKQQLTQAYNNFHIRKLFIGSEIRRFKRFFYNTNINILDYVKKDFSVKTIDISLGGACIISDKPLKMNKDFRVKIQLPNIDTPLIFNAHLAWIIKQDQLSPKDPIQYKMGVEFVKIKEKDKKTLNRFVKTLKNISAES